MSTLLGSKNSLFSGSSRYEELGDPRSRGVASLVKNQANGSRSNSQSTAVPSGSHSSQHPPLPPSLRGKTPTRVITTTTSVSTRTGEESEDYEGENLDVRELKQRMKVTIGKLSQVKKEKDTVVKENQMLQEEVMSLQSNLRQMIQGFSNNTSSCFPMQNELTVQITEFYKYQCLDLFFDVLCVELNMKGIVFFFKLAIIKLLELVNAYLQPSIDAIKSVGAFETLDGPILSVLRKTYQQNFRAMVAQALDIQTTQKIVQEIVTQLKIGRESQDFISEFLIKLGEVLFLSQIADPPLFVDVKAIGQKVSFTPLKHDPFDGFIKQKEDCIIIIPPVYKTHSTDSEILVKALVLQATYEIPN